MQITNISKHGHRGPPSGNGGDCLHSPL